MHASTEARTLFVAPRIDRQACIYIHTHTDSTLHAQTGSQIHARGCRRSSQTHMTCTGSWSGNRKTQHCHGLCMWTNTEAKRKKKKEDILNQHRKAGQGRLEQDVPGVDKENGALNGPRPAAFTAATRTSAGTNKDILKGEFHARHQNGAGLPIPSKQTCRAGRFTGKNDTQRYVRPPYSPVRTGVEDVTFSDVSVTVTMLASERSAFLDTRNCRENSAVNQPHGSIPGAKHEEQSVRSQKNVPCTLAEKVAQLV